MLGPEPDQQQEVRILNRVLRLVPHGVEYEADQRHAEVAIYDFGLDGAKALDIPRSREEKKGTSAPWGIPGVEIKTDSGDKDSDLDVELGPTKAFLYRGIAARLNYFA